MSAPLLTSGQLDTIAPGVRRLVANNPGYMTGPGTNTYIVGHERYVVIDPGPADAQHLARIMAATDGGEIDAVLVTHTHRDHSPGAQWLAEKTGAALLGRSAVDDGRQDATFKPQRQLADGDVITVGTITIHALHTPGHASNHLCYLIDGTGLLLTGDHLMQGSTVVIAPPDGNMSAYLTSLHRLQREPVTRLAPGHGLTIEDAQAEIARIVAHRLQREAKVLEHLKQRSPTSIDQLVGSVYDDVDPRLHPLAKGSLWAHLEKLASDGHARQDGDLWAAQP